MKKPLKILIYSSFILLTAGYFLFPVYKENFNIKYGYRWEEYNPRLAFRLKTVDEIIQYADSVRGKENRLTLEYVKFVNNLISNTFYHGYSYYSFHHNWIAFLSGKLISSDLNAIVLPNDILKHPEAACSQVSIVMAACLKEIGMDYRKVGLKGHFILEARVNNKWYLFDPNLEPCFPNGRKSLAELMQANELLIGYAGKKTPEEIKNIFSRIEYGKVNGELAPNAMVFHKITFFASIMIALFLLLYVVADLSMVVYVNLIKINRVRVLYPVIKKIQIKRAITERKIV